MRRALFFVALATLAIAAAWSVAILPGQVQVGFGNYAYAASVPVTILLLLVLFVVLYAIVRGIGLVIRAPRRMRRLRAQRAQRLGNKAITTTLVALAAGDAPAARQAAARARAFLGDEPQTLLLTAQAAHLNGREDEAQAAFRLLADHKEAGFLGLRGLLRQAVAREDWPAAAQIAQQADAAHPGATWLREERANIALRTGAWKEALQLSSPTVENSTLGHSLATAAAQVEPNASVALRLAREAFKADPTLTAAALEYARRLRAIRKEGQAEDILRRAWQANPHPDVATLYLENITPAQARLQAGQRLVKAVLSHGESQFLLAQLALEAQQFQQAHHYAQAALEAGLRQRRVWRLVARIAEHDHTAQGRRALQDALEQAAQADPDPGWRCTACFAPVPAWGVECPSCHAAGRIAWTCA